MYVETLGWANDYCYILRFENGQHVVSRYAEEIENSDKIVFRGHIEDCYKFFEQVRREEFFSNL